MAQTEQEDCVFRIRYIKAGGHYHCRVFCAPAPNMTYVNMGSVITAEEDWVAFMRAFAGAEFVEVEVG